jgi:predicted RNA-binding protein with PIN domain
VTRWIVDGMNLIGSRPDGWWRDRPGAMRSLAQELSRFAAVSGQPVTVIFDGRPVELGDSPDVEVAFASRLGPNAADDDIARLVTGAPRPAELTVVTSDSALAGRVRSSGAGVVGVRAFRARLEEAAGGG